MQSQVAQIRSGQAVLSGTPGPWSGTIVPANAMQFGVCRYEGSAQPLVLSLACSTSETVAAGTAMGLIGYDPQLGFTCAAQNQVATTYAVMAVGCAIEFGFGACQQTVLFDWMPGSYQLPVCEYANVRAVAWGLNPSIIVTAKASLMPGVGAHKVPTRSQRHSLAGGAGLDINFSFYTRAIDMLAEANADFTLSGDQLFIRRAPSTPTYTPSWGPVPYLPCSFSGTMGRRPMGTLTNNSVAADEVTVVEYLDLGG